MMGLFRWTLRTVSAPVYPGKAQQYRSVIGENLSSCKGFSLLLTIRFQLDVVMIHVLPLQVDRPPQETLRHVMRHVMREKRHVMRQKRHVWTGETRHETEETRHETEETRQDVFYLGIIDEEVHTL